MSTGIFKNHVLKSENEKITSYFTADRTVTVNGRTICGHNGIDIVPEGYVVTPEAGTVTYVKDTVNGVDTSGLNDFGNNVKIKVNEKYLIRFCHLKNGISLNVGEKISVGAEVGYMGNTGFSTGVHLHFGLYDISGGTEVAVDPLPYLEGKLSLTGVSGAETVRALTFKPGDQVRVNAGARDYSGGLLAPFVYTSVFEVMEAKDGRIVVGQKGGVTAAMNEAYLTLVSFAPPSPEISESVIPAEIKLGDTVKVTRGRTAYDGSALASFVYNKAYTVVEVGVKDKNRICLGDGKNIMAAVRRQDLVKL